MPESNETIQDIEQLVEQADAIVQELTAEVQRTTQAASDEGPTVEPAVWTPPDETEEPDPAKSDDESAPKIQETEPDGAEPETIAEPQSSEPAGPEAADSAQTAANAPQQAMPEPAIDEDPADQPTLLVSEGEAGTPLDEPSQAGQAIMMEDARATATAAESDQIDEPCVEIEFDETSEADRAQVLMDEAVPDAAPVERELLADASTNAEETVEARERVRSLDDELARLADEMIDGDFDEESLVADGYPRGNEPDQPAQPATTSPAQTQPEAPAPVAPKAKAEPEPVPEEIKQRVVYYTKRTAKRSCEIARERGPVIAAEVEPAARRACERISNPLHKHPPIVRTSIGWIAVATAAYAALVLFYVAVLRKPTMPESVRQATTLIDDSGRSIASRPDD